MSKTPYEIRLEVLKLAQDREAQKYYSALEVWRGPEGKGNPLTEVPEYPSTSQILSEAEQLKGFIDKS